MRLLGKSGLVLLLLLSFLPIWFFYPYASITTASSAVRTLGQATALVGSVLFCLNFILAARFSFVEFLFFGLNRAYIIHHLTGAIGFILLLLHPVFIILSYLFISPEAAILLINPLSGNIPVWLGSLAILVFVALMLVTFYVKLEYHVWKNTHQWLGVPLLLALTHSYFIGSTLDSQPVLKIYIMGMFIAAVASFVFRQYRKRSAKHKYHYTSTLIQLIGDITYVTLTPVDRIMKFIPGQFVFLEMEHRGVTRESHPFSIVNAPTEPTLSFGIKSVGDYTETLKLLTPGSDVYVEGPYGRFSYVFHKNPKQVWIAGGIGITPFVSMLQSLPTDNTREISLYYCVRNEKEALFLEPIQKLISERTNITSTLWTSADRGRLTVQKISDAVKDLHSADFYLCGPPPMMNELKKQLKDFGIGQGSIHTEEFSIQ